MNHYILIEVAFNTNQENTFLETGDITIIQFASGQFEIKFIDLFVEKFQQNVFAKIQFLSNTVRYDEIVPGESFTLLNNDTEIGKGRFMKVAEIQSSPFAKISF